MLKKVDETWPTDDVCEKAVCAFDTNGTPVIKKQREVCNAVCQPVSSLPVSRQLHSFEFLTTGLRNSSGYGQMLWRMHQNKVCCR